MRQQKIRLISKQGPYALGQFFCEVKYQHCFTQAVSERTIFKEGYRSVEEK